ncbi:MAG: ABC transporter transmembrane domain-containing protein [Candidatus Brocadiia bacterium]|nr:ABC transporter transmembrane domain-containing protein [Candidatus Brocadiia bacterium]
MAGDREKDENEAQQGASCEDGVYRINSDMDVDGRYEHTALEMTDTELRRVAGEEVRERVACKDVDHVRCVEFIGNGMLEAWLHDGRTIRLIRYSKSLSDYFEKAEAEINTRLGRELTEEEQEKKAADGAHEARLVYRCPNCGYPLRHQTDVCPKCVSVRLQLLRLLKFLKPYWLTAAFSLLVASGMTALALVPAALSRELVDGPLHTPDVAEGPRRAHENAFVDIEAREYADKYGVDGSILIGSGPRNLVTEKDIDAYRDQSGRFASPEAQKMAWERLASPKVVAGTGPRGRITEQDLKEYLAEADLLPATGTARKLAFLLGLDLREIQGGEAGGEITEGDVKVASMPGRYRWLGKLVAALLGVFVVRAFLRWAQTRLMGWMAVRLMFDIRSKLYRALQRLSLSFYDREHTGRIMSRVTGDTAQLNGFVVSGFQTMIISVLFIIGICILMLMRHPKLAVLTLLPTPMMVLGSYLFAKKIGGIYSRIYRRRAGLYRVLSDTISGIRIVKAFGQEKREIGSFEDKSRDFADATTESIKLTSVFSPTMVMLTALGTLVIYSYGGYLVVSGKEGLTIGDLLMFLTLMAQFYAPVQTLTELTNTFQSAAVACERVFGIIDAPSEVADTVDAKPIEEMKGHFVLDHVHFSYEKSERILKRINFEVQPGEIIGLVGATGSGKSTLVKLISRFYDPTRGRILLDGRDLREIRLQDLRRHIGMVLQETFLFGSTIRENIAYGRPDATNDEVVGAARAANAHDFIMAMPDAYDSRVGERGLSLSGGERQRVAIARAILMDPTILILDEATSAVDTVTELQIQEALDRLMKGRTVFAIAHRLSTLKNAHRLMVMDKGEIVETGTHAELMAKEGGIYRNLVEIQNLFARRSPSEEEEQEEEDSLSQFNA